MMGGVCRPKHVEQLRNIGRINSTTRLHLVGSFYETYFNTISYLYCSECFVWMLLNGSDLWSWRTENIRKITHPDGNKEMMTMMMVMMMMMMTMTTMMIMTMMMMTTTMTTTMMITTTTMIMTTVMMMMMMTTTMTTMVMTTTTMMTMMMTTTTTTTMTTMITVFRKEKLLMVIVAWWEVYCLTTNTVFVWQFFSKETVPYMRFWTHAFTRLFSTSASAAIFAIWLKPSM